MNDPVKGCDVYKNIGCAHVDGYLCDYPNCSILKEYKMNERIKELWDKAATVSAAFPSGQNNSWETQVNFMERFAELIVRECANQCDLLLDHKISSEWARGTHDCSKAIRKHFGVEE